jgi:roadblock/LC7 domain-containing protein
MRQVALPRALLKGFDYGLYRLRSGGNAGYLIIRQLTMEDIVGMGIANDLLAKPGVIAVGEYAYRGDRFSYRGALTEEYARMASIMCRATTMGANMEGAMFEALRSGSGLHPPRGWLVHGPAHTVCVIANVFCLLDNTRASINDIVKFMYQGLANVPADII